MLLFPASGAAFYGFGRYFFALLFYGFGRYILVGLFVFNGGNPCSMVATRAQWWQPVLNGGKPCSTVANRDKPVLNSGKPVAYRHR
jgi:hypothetical protein